MLISLPLSINLGYTAGEIRMEDKDLKEYLLTQIKEINKYVIEHPELSRTDAASKWIEKNAAEFSKRWKKHS